MKGKDYRLRKILYQLRSLQAKKVKSVQWKLKQEQLEFLSEYFEIRPFLYIVNTRRFRNIYNIKTVWSRESIMPTKAAKVKWLVSSRTKNLKLCNSSKSRISRLSIQFIWAIKSHSKRLRNGASLNIAKILEYSKQLWYYIHKIKSKFILYNKQQGKESIVQKLNTRKAWIY